MTQTSGKLNYAWLINGLPYAHWQGQPPGFGRPIHPTRRVLDAPPVHEFASPVGGTYPPWFDPAYWNEGVKPRLDLKAHARALLRNTRHLLVEIILRRQIAVFTAGLALAMLGRRRWPLLIEPGPSWMLLLPALAAFVMYSLIHVENRFVAPFIVLMWLGILSALTVPARTEVKRAAEAILVAAAVGVMLPSITAHTLELLTNPRLGGGEYSEWRIADGLHKAGVKPGDHVAVVGFSLGAYWARLAQVRIVAEICAERPRPPWNCGGEQHAIRDFWVASPDTKDQVYAAFRRAGARAVVAGSVGDVRLVGGGVVLPDEWLRIPGTSYFVYFLDR